MPPAQSFVNAAYLKSSSKNGSPQKLVKVGKVIGAHSLKGEIKARFFSGEASWLSNLKTLILKTESDLSSDLLGELIIQKFRLNEGVAIVKLQGIDNRNDSEALKGRTIWIPEENLLSQPGEKIFLREILNFQVVDPSGKVLGKITGFDSNNSQDLLVIEVLPESGSTFSALIPLVKPFLKSIDHKTQTVVMDLPDGLLEANRAL